VITCIDIFAAVGVLYIVPVCGDRKYISLGSRSSGWVGQGRIPELNETSETATEDAPPAAKEGIPWLRTSSVPDFLAIRRWAELVTNHPSFMLTTWNRISGRYRATVSCVAGRGIRE